MTAKALEEVLRRAEVLNDRRRGLHRTRRRSCVVRLHTGLFATQQPWPSVRNAWCTTSAMPELVLLLSVSSRYSVPIPNEETCKHVTDKQMHVSLSVTFCQVPPDGGRPTRRPGPSRHGLIIINWLVSPVRRIGEHVGPKLRHLAVVAVLTGVGEKDATGIVLRRPQLARAAGARFWSPFLRYAYHFLLRVEAMTCQRPTIANGSET